MNVLNDNCRVLNNVLSVIFGLKHGTERSVAETERNTEDFEGELSAIDESLKRADFEKRRKQALSENDEVVQLLSELREKKQLLTDVYKDILREIMGVKAPEVIQEIAIEENIADQWSMRKKEYNDASNSLGKSKDSFERDNRQLLQIYSGFAMEDVFRGIDDLPEYTADTEDYCKTAGIQLESVAHSRWVGAFWQSKGLIVIPTVSWSDAKSYGFCFDGIEKGSIVAVGMIGCKHSKISFLRGYNAMLERVEPSAIICLGNPFAEMQGNIIAVDYINSRKVAR